MIIAYLTTKYLISIDYVVDITQVSDQGPALPSCYFKHAWCNIVRINVLIISIRVSLNVDHVRSHTRSLAQIEGKYC